MWKEILKSYSKNPRNVKTVTKNKGGIWFYVFVEDDRLFISGGTKAPASKLKGKIELKESEFEIVMRAYNKNGEYMTSKEKHQTFHSSYWIGILSEFDK